MDISSVKTGAEKSLSFSGSLVTTQTSLGGPGWAIPEQCADFYPNQDTKEIGKLVEDISMRIDRNAVQPDFIVKVRPGGSP